MKRKIAHAIIFYSTVTFDIFKNTLIDYSYFKRIEKTGEDFMLSDFFSAIRWHETVCKIILDLSHDQLDLKDESVPSYPDLLKKLNVEKLTLPLVQEAARTLMKDLPHAKEHREYINYLLGINDD